MSVKIATASLAGAPLDYMMCKGAGHFAVYPTYGKGPRFLQLWSASSAKPLHPSTKWAHGGDIIERHKISPVHEPNLPACTRWKATCATVPVPYYGPTPLIAVGRCYVASLFGEFVFVPEELVA